MRSGIAQSFLESGNAATTKTHDESVKELTKSPDSAEICECCCRCGRSPNGSPLARGKRRSKSYTAIRTAISEWSGWNQDVDIQKSQEPVSVEPPRRQYRAGESPLERLPAEVLGKSNGKAMNTFKLGHSRNNWLTNNSR